MKDLLFTLIQILSEKGGNTCLGEFEEPSSIGPDFSVQRSGFKLREQRSS